MAFEQVIVRTADGQQYGPVSMQTMQGWHSEGRVPKDAMLLDAVTGESQPVANVFSLSTPPPPPVWHAAPVATAPSGMDHIIPVKNPNALFSYYLGVFGLICAPILGPIALVLGFLGLRDFRKLAVGRAHAWVGIILGGLETLASLVAIIMIILGASQH